ncbi:MAG: hypothetical protein JXA68_04960 [Ignavibacteriales bacterium]|nr:hypothetical protein [Ignavibacteriales bacterium]
MLIVKKIFLLLFVLTFSINAQIKVNENQLKSFLDEKEKIYEDICIQMGIANWNVYTQENEADQNTPKARFSVLFSNDSLNQIINGWHSKIENISNDTLKRRVEVWHRVLTGAKVDMDPEVFELENQLEEWLSGSIPKEEIPSTQELSNMILHLMKLRNEKAIKLGYENYAVMMLDLSEIGYNWFMDFVDEILKRTKPHYDKIINDLKKELKKDTITIFDLRGIIQEYYMATGDAITLNENQTMIGMMSSILSDIGINYEELPARFVEKEVPYGGNGLAINVPNDFRAVVNVGMPLSVWMHELGHGLQAMFTTINYPILEGYEWCLGEGCPGYSEGMAETSARFTRNTEVIKKYSQYEVNNQNSVINKYSAMFLRFSLISVLFEIEFYKDLNQDPAVLTNNLYKDILYFDNPIGSSLNLSENIIYVSYPVYLQNYMLADIISWQVHSKLEEVFGKEYGFNKDVSNYLIKYFYSSGEYFPWQERLLNGTGKELDVDGYLKSFGY